MRFYTFHLIVASVSCSPPSPAHPARGSYELFLARSNREGEVRDAKLKKLSWLNVNSIDDLEQKVGEIIVAVMVVNLLEMSLHMVRMCVTI